MGSILVETAVKNDPTNSDWTENGAGYLVNHNYGFGSIDATAAVNTALNWQPVRRENSLSSEIIDVNSNIPDNNPIGFTSTTNISQELNIEWVEVITDLDLLNDDLEVILTSPNGTESILSPQGNGLDIDSNNSSNWMFTSARHWGESSAGEWSLTVIDHQNSPEEITWNNWQLNLFGTSETSFSNSNNSYDNVFLNEPSDFDEFSIRVDFVAPNTPTVDSDDVLDSDDRTNTFNDTTLEEEDLTSTSNTVHRFLNQDTGVHFYTGNETERDAVLQLSNFNYEGASYQSVDPLTGQDRSTPVYRFLNRDTGVHLYTTSEIEREAVQELPNFSFEGEAFFAYPSEVDGSIPIFRFFNTSTGAHFYTPSAVERDAVLDLPDFQAEGIAYHALPLAE